MRLRFIAAIGLLPLLSAQATSQELSRAERISEADLIVTGAVQAVYGGQVEAAPGATGPFHLAEVTVDGVEKGRGTRSGQLLYVRFPSSQNPFEAGDDAEQVSRFRLFLRVAPDGGHDLLPDGAERAATGLSVSDAETLRALERVVEELLAASLPGQGRRRRELIDGLRLPDHATWFRGLFGELGSARHRGASRLLQTLAPFLQRTLSKVRAVRPDGAVAYTVFRAEGQQAIGLQRRATFAMRRKVPLYTVRFDEAGESLWSFAWVRGQFRWLGKLQALPREPLVSEIGLSSLSLDPERPGDATLRVTLTNRGAETVVDVPTRYDGVTVRLLGRGLRHAWPSALRVRERPRQVTEPLEPGESRVLLEVRLRDLFQAGEGGWDWDWEAHPVPPTSPIHRYRAAGYEEEATFFISLEAGARTIHSKPVTLRIVKSL